MICLRMVYFLSYIHLVEGFNWVAEANFWKYLQVRSSIMLKSYIVADNTVIDRLKLPPENRKAAKFL